MERSWTTGHLCPEFLWTPCHVGPNLKNSLLVSFSAKICSCYLCCASQEVTQPDFFLLTSLGNLTEKVFSFRTSSHLTPICPLRLVLGRSQVSCKGMVGYVLWGKGSLGSWKVSNQKHLLPLDLLGTLKNWDGSFSTLMSSLAGVPIPCILGVSPSLL